MNIITYKDRDGIERSFYLTIEYLPETGSVKPYELWTHRVGGRSARLSSWKTLAAVSKAYPEATVSEAAAAAANA